MKTVLITGVTGQDGSYLAEILLEKGWRVIGLKRWTSQDNTANIRHLEAEENFETVYWDAHDAPSIINPIVDNEPDIIFNMAAPSFIGQSYCNPDAEIAALYKPLIHVCETLIKMGTRGLNTRVYQASSSEIFGDIKGGMQLESPKNPISPYGIGKLAAFNLARYYRELGVHVSNGVLFNHESPRRPETFLSRKVVKGLCELALNVRKEPVEIWDDVPMRDFGYAGEYMHIVINEMLNQKYPRDFIVATGKSISVGLFCHLAAGELVSRGEILPDQYLTVNESKRRPTDILDMSISKEVLSREGFIATTPVEQTIKIMVNAELDRIRREYQL